MEKEKPAPPTTVVCVFPFEDGWTVGFSRGHYALPMARDEALREVARLAGRENLPAIAIRDSGGQLEQWLPLDALAQTGESRPGSPEVPAAVFTTPCLPIQHGTCEGCEAAANSDAPA